MPPKLGNDRALRIVAAAREEFARRGFAGARVDQIARRAGVNKQLLFYYYAPSAASSRQCWPRPQAIWKWRSRDSRTRPADRWNGSVSRSARSLNSSPKPSGGRAARAGNTVGRGAAFAPAINRLVVLLAEGQGLGKVRDDLDPHLAAARL